MDDTEPTLPPHPDTTPPIIRPLRPSLLTRKRTYDQSLYDGEPLTATSSDPALFSGDEQDVIGAEDYTTKRKKKMYSGSWWNHRMKAGKEDRKKEFKRNFDSGIFMGSESEPLSSDSITSLEEELIRDQAAAAGPSKVSVTLFGHHLPSKMDSTPRAQVNQHPYASEDLDATPRKKLVTKKQQEPEGSFDTGSTDLDQHRAVMQIVRKCIDDGHETVDLSGHMLSELPSEIVELAFMTKHANFITGMLESGTSMEVNLRLFLGNNFLRRLPLPVLDLTNLRELSLRRNKLTRLPAGIRSLVKLEKLNVSGNKLTYLPFEVIELVAHHRLSEVTTEPNLWESFDPEAVNYTVQDTFDEVNRGIFHEHGLWRAFPPEESRIHGHSQRMPSLTEMSLRQLARLRPLEDLRLHMPEDTSPKVLNALQRLNESLEEGGWRCNSCQRPIVEAERDWIEWWRVHHVYFPVKRMQCWSCPGKHTEWCDI